MMKTITIYEAGNAIPIGTQDPCALTVREADELERYVYGNGLKASCFLWKRNQLRIINYVGYIQLSTIAIEILPKISSSNTVQNSRKALLMLLRESGYLKVSYSPQATQRIAEDNLFEIFGRLFTELLIHEVRRGLIAGYIYHEENISLPRGKILLAKQMVNCIRRIPKAYCGFDEFTVNQPINQFLKMVIRFLLVRIRDQYTINMLLDCLLRFDEVEDVMLRMVDVEKVQVDRMSQRYGTILLLGKLFYQGQVVMMEQGRINTFSILFSMNELFEKYIAQMCIRHLPYHTRAQKINKKLWINTQTGKGIFSLCPDIIIEFDNGKKLIIDTKWKWIREKDYRYGVSREDYYQMYAYLTRDPMVQATILLYPHHEALNASGTFFESYHVEQQPEKKFFIASVFYENKETTIADIMRIVDAAQ